MSELQRFDFSGYGVRVIVINNEPWWIAKDVCDLLGYKDPTTAVRSHCRGVQKLHPIVDSLGRLQEARIISEPDLLRLIVTSTLPEAIKFESWVFETVLPQIRKTGSYQPKMPQSFPEALRAYATEVEEKEKLKTIIEEQRPKVELAEKCLMAENVQTMLEIAKVLGIGRTTLFKFLRDQKILMRNNNPYENYTEKHAGYFKVIEKQIEMGTNLVNKTQTLVTAKGLNFIRELLKKNGIS